MAADCWLRCIRITDAALDRPLRPPSRRESLQLGACSSSIPGVGDGRETIAGRGKQERY
jgi:hypothetical protein